MTENQKLEEALRLYHEREDYFERNQKMYYSQIRRELATFDIINCEGNGLFWKLIGHTAGIYHDRSIDHKSVFESTQRKKGLNGVGLTTASDWFERYDGRVFVRRLLVDGPDVCLPNLHCLSSYFMQKTRGRSYPDLKTRDGRWKLILAALDFHIFGRDIFTWKGKDDGIFCTHLIAAWYIYCGLTVYSSGGDLDLALEKGREYEPDDMREGGKFELKLREGLTLGNEIEIFKEKK